MSATRLLYVENVANGRAAAEREWRAVQYSCGTDA